MMKAARTIALGLLAGALLALVCHILQSLGPGAYVDVKLRLFIDFLVFFVGFFPVTVAASSENEKAATVGQHCQCPARCCSFCPPKL